MKLIYALLDACKSAVRAALQPVAHLLNRLSGGKLSPNTLTIISLVMHIPAAWLIGQGYFGYAALLIVIFGLFDALDGALARLQHSESKRGMLLDSVTDRMKEVILYTGVAVSFVNYGREEIVYWVVLAAGASLVVSYINAWGETVAAGHSNKEAVNQAFRSGIARYEVRMFLLIVGLASSRLILSVMVIAVLSVFTIFERLIKVDRSL